MPLDFYSACLTIAERHNRNDQSSCGSLLQQLDHVLAPIPFRTIQNRVSIVGLGCDIGSALQQAASASDAGTSRMWVGELSRYLEGVEVVAE